MQTFFRQRLLSFCSAALLALGCAHAQTLARPGWAGSGLTPEPWWQHAVLYRIDGTPLPTLAQLPSLQAFGIDAILLTPESMQTSASPAPATTADSTAIANQPLSVDDLLFECSRLHIRVLVPLDLAPPNASPDNTVALARSWLYRGAAGFVVMNLDKLSQSVASSATSAPQTSPGTPNTAQTHHRRATVHAIHLAPSVADPQILTDIRKVIAQFPGERILIGAPSANATPSPSLQLQIAALGPANDTARLAMLAAQTSPRTALALADTASLSPIDAARLLATSAPAILDSAAISPDLLLHVFPPLPKATEPEPAPAPKPPPPPANVYGAYVPYAQKDTTAERRRKAAEEKAAKEAAKIAEDTFPVQPMYQAVSDTPEGYAAFYHRLIQLHRANAALHGGTLHALDTGSQAFAWSATRAGAPTLVVVCNPSSTAQQIDLRNGLSKLENSREMLRTLLHTAAASGVVNPGKVTVGANGVYAGELSYGYTYR